MAKKFGDKAKLKRTAAQLSNRLHQAGIGSVVTMYDPPKITTPATDGWRARLGSTGRGKPFLELWLDRFTGSGARRFQVCAFSPQEGVIAALTKRVNQKLMPATRFTRKDTKNSGYFKLREPLASSMQGRPLLETYRSESFFGIYDPSSKRTNESTQRFLKRAEAFLLEIIASSSASGRSAIRNDYPRHEDRKQVNAHLRRDRSGYLAALCKERDEYQCTVCKKDYSSIYGPKLGADFAEAHHMVPLGKLNDHVRSTVDDLITVCADCHRMLHRMAGAPSDVKKLRTIVRKRQLNRR